MSKPTLEDFSRSIPVDLSCECGSTNPPYVHRKGSAGITYSDWRKYEGLSVCLECGGTRKAEKARRKR
jgi:hypothetical protein